MSIIESPEIDTYKYNQLIFDKRTKAIQWSKDSLQDRVPEQLDILMQNKTKQNKTKTNKTKPKTMTLKMNLTSFTKINSKWIIDINVKHKTIKLLEDDIGENPNDFGYMMPF